MLPYISSFLFQESVGLINRNNASTYISTKSPKGLNVLSAAVFIAGEMAGSGVLALPRAVVDSGKWFCMCFHILYIYWRPRNNSHDEGQQKESCLDVTDKPAVVCIFYAWLSCLLAHMQICLTRQDLIRVNELLAVWNVDNVWPEFKEVFFPLVQYP